MRRKLSWSKTSSWWQSQIMNWSLALSSWENIIIYAIGFHESWRVQNCDIKVESRNIFKSIQYLYVWIAEQFISFIQSQCNGLSFHLFNTLFDFLIFLHNPTTFLLSSTLPCLCGCIAGKTIVCGRKSIIFGCPRSVSPLFLVKVYEQILHILRSSWSPF